MQLDQISYLKVLLLADIFTIKTAGITLFYDDKFLVHCLLLYKTAFLKKKV